MNEDIDNLIAYLEKGNYLLKTTKSLNETFSKNVIVWKKDNGIPSNDVLTDLSIEYLFDMSSFLIIYHKKFPGQIISNSFVINGIAYRFSKAIKLLFSGDYSELADLLYKNRGAIIYLDFS